MPRYKVAALCEISEKAWSEKAQWDALLSECYEHALPNRNPYAFNGTGKPNASKTGAGRDKSSTRVLDSTLMNDAVKLANKLQYELFPIGSHWADLTPGPFVKDDQKQNARGQLQALQELLFTVIQLSNFDLAIAEWLLELVVAGMACMLVQPGTEDSPIVFQAVPQSHVAVREGAFGFIDLISRKHMMRRSLIRQTWKDAKVPDKANDQDDDPECELIEVTYLDYLDGWWRYDVVLLAEGGSERASKDRIVQRDYHRSPWSIARWSKAAGEAQGRSLVMNALPDARVLSSVKKYILQQAALSIGGVFLVKHGGVLNVNTMKIFPGAKIPVQSTGGTNGASVAPLPMGGDVQLAQIVMGDLVTSIHKIMLNDAVPELQDGIRTATEWVERMRELQQSVGAPFSRVLKEGVVPMLEAILMIMGGMKIIPMPENGAIKLNNGEIKVSFNSPLVQQEALREVENVLNAAMATRQLGGVQYGDQMVAASFNVEAAGAWIADKMGASEKMLRPEAERKQLMANFGAMMGAQAANGNAPAVGGAGGVAPQRMAA